jgi:hypothetical protein
MDLVDRATEQLRQKAEVLRELAELSAVPTADRMSWDDTAEGERLRRYEFTCNRTLLRIFELLLKVRRTGDDLDLGTIAIPGSSVPSGKMDAIDIPRSVVATVINPAAEPIQPPDPPIEANPDCESAPNEANSNAHASSSTNCDDRKEFRTDKPQLDCKAGGVGITGNEKIQPALQRLLTGRESTLLDLSSIFDR